MVKALYTGRHFTNVTWESVHLVHRAGKVLTAPHLTLSYCVTLLSTRKHLRQMAYLKKGAFNY